jgi:hypothetical protein
MLRVAFDGEWKMGSAGSLSPQDYLRFVQEHVIRTRVDAVRAVDPAARFSTRSGILLFTESQTAEETRESMKQNGYAKEEIDDLLCRPQFLFPDGEAWQRDGFRMYDRHVRDVADEVWKTLIDGMPDFAIEPFRKMAIGPADVPFFHAGADYVPSGGSYVLLARNLLILPMWFAALRKLPRPWNEQELEGEVLRRFVGAAAIAVKAFTGNTIVGYHSYTHALLNSPELLASGRMLPTGLTKEQRLEAELTQRNDLLSCERFIIAHELAHVLMLHTEKLREWGPRSGWSRAQSLQRAKELREAETNADILALSVLVRLTPAANSNILKPGYVFTGDERLDVLIVLFMLFHVMEDPGESTAPDAIHPPALERLMIMARVLIGRTQGPEVEKRFFAEFWPKIEQDMDVLRTLLAAAVVQAKPRIISHADAEAFP